MSASPSSPKASSRSRLYFGLAVSLLFFTASGFISYENTQRLKNNITQTSHTHDTLLGLLDLVSTLKDAETGQRGYILTGDAAYLEPYLKAKESIGAKIKNLDELNKAEHINFTLIEQVRKNTQSKFNEIESVLETYHSKGRSAAIQIITAGKGKAVMDSLRRDIEIMKKEEQGIRDARIIAREQAYRISLVSGLIAAFSGALLAVIVAVLLARVMKQRERDDWIRNGQAGIAAAMIGDQTIDELGRNILSFLAEYFGAHGGAFFVRGKDGFQKITTYGIPEGSNIPEKFGADDGLLGQAVRDRKPFVVRNVPEGYMVIGSALGRAKPEHLVISPSVVDNTANSVIELGFINDLGDDAIELLDKVTETIGIAVRTADYRTHLQNLLEETQRQSEELQSQSEELRVSNEELEEQSRALKESQARLEQQQAELEQTNTQLEEQTQLLENQKNDLENANEDILSKARDLELASQYKSDFLANMSHELRTPLNSSLILAKLLADNPQGNLSDEQVQFAQTIQSAGNDLLTLINDILDLSKIEAGHMEIHAETIRISRLANDLGNIFTPTAAQKGLNFTISIADGCPETVVTDKQRLEQVLKNLLSNAIKFTDQGAVDLSIRLDGGSIAFTVNDTGIGISKEQQQTIFEAFRQADGTISRKYGGTGLGLSISRELTKLLGGAISLHSTQGKGSSFTLTIPQNYTSIAVQDRTSLQAPSIFANTVPPAPMPESAEAETAPLRAPPFEDDRGRIRSGSRSILVIEDDAVFARILYDLAKELEFMCLVANTAEDGLNIAKQYLPSAVLDRLKRNQHTRHIPVHVLSAGDYTQAALSMGAVGYLPKPVKRDELIDAIHQMETRLSRTMHKVLLVEDDQIQRESVCKLLGSNDVEIVGAATAAECLAQLKDNTFDCMVLDLTLPDASGYSLLETLSREDAYSFPPVIVYTGRDLSTDEEQKLRKYSKSIIIKGAKSPERLLDEVTLFLHQVVSDLPAEKQKLLQKARNRDEALEGRRILIVEDDVRNVYSLTNILEPRGASVEIARNGQEALDVLQKAQDNPDRKIDLVLMDVMMPVMDGLTATREIRKQKSWKKLPIIVLTAKAMKDDQERCLDAGANDYMAKPLDVEKLLSLVRVWMPR